MSTTTTTSPQPLTPPQRTHKQLTLYLAGTTFFTLSTLLTRRAIHRKHLWPKPAFYTPSNLPPPIPINGTVEAVEALQLATVNVLGFVMMLGGGCAWAFDVAGWEEVRGRLGRRREEGGDEGGEKEEMELEGLGLGEWVRGVGGGVDGVVERARERRRRERREEREREMGGREDKEMGGREEGVRKEDRVESLAVVENRTPDQEKEKKPWWRPW